MDVEVLVIPECPNEAKAMADVRSALDDVGLSRIPITKTVIDTQEEAERRHFGGSPTILIDGDDPFAAPGQSPALACRLFATPAGLAVVPDIRQLREAFKRAADVNLNTKGTM
jgi:hypothetical protein